MVTSLDPGDLAAVRDQDELSPDVAATADAVGLGGAVEWERLHLDHELVLCQQFSDLCQRLHGPAVRAATSHPGSGLAGCEVGDGHYPGRLGYQAVEVDPVGGDAEGGQGLLLCGEILGQREALA
jgi:hypothetical protein